MSNNLDLAGKYQILANEFAKVRGQVTVLKKAIVDEQSKNQELQEHLNQKDQNLRRNTQEIETISFLNNQLRSRLEILQQELNDIELQSKLKKNKQQKRDLSFNDNRHSNDDVLMQELENKIKDYEILHRKVFDLDKQIQDADNEKRSYRSTVEQLQSEMEEMQTIHRRTLDENNQILKQIKQENETLNEKLKQQLLVAETCITVSTQPHSAEPNGLTSDDKSTIRLSSFDVGTTEQLPEIYLHKYLKSWIDAFTEFTIYIEERLKNHKSFNSSNDTSEKIQSKTFCTQLSRIEQIFLDKRDHHNNLILNCLHFINGQSQQNQQQQKMSLRPSMTQTVKAYQLHSENFLHMLKTKLFDRPSTNTAANNNTDSMNFAELYSMFLSSCEKILTLAVRSVCDEPDMSVKDNNESEIDTIDKQKHIQLTISNLNKTITDLLQKWSKNLSKIREISALIIQFDSSKSSFTPETLKQTINDLLSSLQAGTIIHCDLDKSYNDKLCLEYELTVSPVHLTTTDECILSALRKISNLDQQIGQLIKTNHKYLFEQKKQKRLDNNSNISDDNQQNAIHSKTILYNAEIIGTLEQEKEHWRLEYQLLKIKYEKMRDDYTKQIDELRQKNHEMLINNSDVNENDVAFPQHMPSIEQSTTLSSLTDRGRTSSEPPSERETMIKNYYSQKILDLETKLQLVNSKAISFYNELQNAHQRLKLSKEQEKKLENEIELIGQDMAKMRDELATTTKSYEEQIATMSDHLASLNERLTMQNDEIDRLQHRPTASKDSKKSKK